MDEKNEIRDAVRQHIIDSILFGDADKLDDAVSFQESGVLDSVGFLDVITFVEERFQIQIVDGELVPENFDTVDRIVDFVQGKRSTKTLCAE
ncbi:MAG: acyl carrier protein [Phycisphaerales bacterium]